MDTPIFETWLRSCHRLKKKQTPPVARKLLISRPVRLGLRHNVNVCLKMTEDVINHFGPIEKHQDDTSLQALQAVYTVSQKRQQLYS